MNDRLTIDYEYFSEDGIEVLTVARGDEALYQYMGKEAQLLYRLLIGDKLAQAAIEYKMPININSR